MYKLVNMKLLSAYPVMLDQYTIVKTFYLKTSNRYNPEKSLLEVLWLKTNKKFPRI